MKKGFFGKTKRKKEKVLKVPGNSSPISQCTWHPPKNKFTWANQALKPSPHPVTTYT